MDAQPAADVLGVDCPRGAYPVESRGIPPAHGLPCSRPLDFTFKSVGSRNFIAERMIGAEAGYRSLLVSKLYLDVALFRNGYDDLYGYGTPTAALATTPSPTHLNFNLPIANEEKGFTDGFEIGPDWQSRRWWTVKGSYSYPAHESGEQDDQSQRCRSLESVRRCQAREPHHQILGQSSIDLPKHFEFDQTYRYVSGLSGQSVGGYNSADVRLGWHISKQFELSVDGDNVPSTASRGIRRGCRDVCRHPAQCVREVKLGKSGQVNSTANSWRALMLRAVRPDARACAI